VAEVARARRGRGERGAKSAGKGAEKRGSGLPFCCLRQRWLELVVNKNNAKL
jgi:hypothetical protein